MKTLKQLLKESLTNTHNYVYKNREELIEQITQHMIYHIKEWLTQKRQEISNDKKMSTPNQIGSLRMIDELLGELEK